jgi:hypothetical protein
LEVYVVVNKVTLGSEALGVFSSPEKGLKFMDGVARTTGYFCHIKKSLIRGYYQPPHHVFAAHTYNRREDVHILEGIYSKLSPARRAAGREGKTIEFSIDATEEIHIFMNE